MRRWLLLVGLLGCLDAQAQSPVWALKGAHNTVYLAGSVHLLKKDDMSLPPAFERAYAAAKTLVMEVDIDEMDSPGRAGADPAERHARRGHDAARFDRTGKL